MNSVTEKELRPRRWTRRLLTASAIIVGVLAILVVLIALIAPRIISTDSARTAIERTVSKELGGTVTIDRLNLVLFPRPEIKIRNLTIDVPGAASASVASASIYARLLPLLRGRFEVSSVTLDRPVLALALPPAPEGGGDRARRKTKTAGRSTGAVLAVAGRTMPDLSLKISRGSLSLAREGRTVLSFGDLGAELTFVAGRQAEEEPPVAAPDDHFHITGSARTVLGGTAGLPGPVSISIGRFDARPTDLAVRPSRAGLLDMDMTLSGSVRDYLSGAPGLNIVFCGSVGQKGLNWLRDLAGLAETAAFRAPVSVRDVRLRTSGRGTTANTSVTGTITLQDNAAVSFTLQKKPDLLTIERLEVKDRDSDAVLRLTSGKQDLDLAFTGILTGATLSRIIDREQPLFRRIAGDLRVHLPRDRWIEAAAEGALEGEGVMIASRLTGSFAVDRISAQARGRTIDLRPLVLSLGPDILTAEGTATLSEAGVAVDLDVSSDRINVASLQELLKARKRESERAAAPPADRRLRVEAELRLRAAAVTFPSYTAEAVAMTLSMAEGRTAADVEQATVCGIGLKGTLQVSGPAVEIRFEPRVQGGALNDSIRCIMPQGPEITARSS